MAAASLGEAILRIGANVSGAVKGLTDVSNKLTGASQMAQKFGASLSAAGRQAALFGTAVLAAFAPIIKIGADFEQAMANVKAVMTDVQQAADATGSKFLALTERAKELGASTKFTATQVAEAMKFMALAGFDAKDTIEGVEGVLNLAAAGMLELGRASDIATDTLTAFGLSVKSLQRINDVLATTATNSNTTINQMGEAMKMVAPLANTLGQNIEEVSAALGVLANAGLKGSVAGVGLAQIFSQLTKNGKNVQKVLAKYGLTIEDVSPEINSLTDIIRTFTMVNISAGDAMTIFGQRAGRSFLALKNQGVPALEALRKKNEEATGAAQRMADIQMDTVIGSFLKLKSAMAGFSIEIFESLNTVLRSSIQMLTKWVNIAIDWAKKNKELVAGVGKVAFVIGALSVVLGTAAIVIGSVVTTLGLMAFAFSSINPVVIGITAAILGLTVLFTAVLIPIIGAIIANWEKLSSTFAKVWEKTLKPAWENFVEAIKRGWEDTIKPAWDSLVESVGHLIDTIGRLYLTLGESGALKAFGNAVATVGSIALAAFIEAIELLVLSIRILADATELAVEWIMKLKRAMGLAGPTITFTSEGLLDNARLLKKVANHVDELVTALKKLSDENADGAAKMRKMLELQKRRSTLTVLEQKDLAKLEQETAGYVDTLQDRIAAEEEAIATLEEFITREGVKNSTAVAGAKAQLEASRKSKKGLTEQLDLARSMNRVKEEGIDGLNTELEVNKEHIGVVEKLIEKTKSFIEENKKLGIGNKGNNEILKEQQAELEGLIVIQDALNAQSKEKLAFLDRANNDTAKALELEQQFLKAMKEKEQAIEDIIAADTKLEELEKRLNASKLTGMAAEMEKIQELLKADKELIKSRETLAQTIKDKLIIEREELLRQKDMANNWRRLLKIEKEIVKQEEKLAAGRELLAKASKAAADAEEKLRKSMAQGRKDALRDAEIGELEQQGRAVEALRLRHQKEIEQQKIQNDKIFELVDGADKKLVASQRKRREELQQRRRDRELEAAIAEAEGKKEVVKAADKQEKLEDQITGQLAKQVRSIRDMINLHKALFAIQDEKNRRAEVALDKVTEKSKQIGMIEKNIAAAKKRGDLEAEQRGRIRLEAARQEKALAQGQAGQAAGAAGGQDANQEQRLQKMKAIAEAMNRLKEDMATAQVEIQEILNAITIDFGAAPKMWVDAFIGAWVQEAQRIVAAVKRTMAEVSQALDPGQRQSPSVIDRWEMHADEARKGIQGVQKTINQNMPNMSNFSPGAAVQASPAGAVPAAAAVGGTTTNNNNDNRSVTMDINTNMDADNIQRVIGRALAPVGMNKGGTI